MVGTKRQDWGPRSLGEELAMDELFMNDSDYVKTLESIKRDIS